jgi:hypothetical protein
MVRLLGEPEVQVYAAFERALARAGRVDVTLVSVYAISEAGVRLTFAGRRLNDAREFEVEALVRIPTDEVLARFNLRTQTSAFLSSFASIAEAELKWHLGLDIELAPFRADDREPTSSPPQASLASPDRTQKSERVGEAPGGEHSPLGGVRVYAVFFVAVLLSLVVGYVVGHTRASRPWSTRVERYTDVEQQHGAASFVETSSEANNGAACVGSAMGIGEVRKADEAHCEEEPRMRDDAQQKRTDAPRQPEEREGENARQEAKKDADGEEAEQVKEAPRGRDELQRGEEEARRPGEEGDAVHSGRRTGSARKATPFPSTVKRSRRLSKQRPVTQGVFVSQWGQTSFLTQSRCRRSRWSRRSSTL